MNKKGYLIQMYADNVLCGYVNISNVYNYDCQFTKFWKRFYYAIKSGGLYLTVHLSDIVDEFDWEKCQIQIFPSTFSCWIASKVYNSHHTMLIRDYGHGELPVGKITYKFIKI